jgi:hypothetical protein
MIDSSILQGVLTQFGFQRTNIDIFASRLNTQFPAYVSYRPDPGAIAVDAFTLNLAKFQFYAFPPFSVIATLLQKIQEEGATGIVVVPDWPTQSWYAKAMQMCRTCGSGEKPAEIAGPTLGVAPPTQIAGASSLPLIRQQLIAQGLSDGTIQIIMAPSNRKTISVLSFKMD